MNNPPAFPTPVIVPEGQFTSVSNDGMTLRDYFAARILPTIMLAWNNNDPQSWDDKKDKICSIAYAFSDAMLKAREQQ